LKERISNREIFSDIFCLKFEN